MIRRPWMPPRPEPRFAHERQRFACGRASKLLLDWVQQSPGRSEPEVHFRSLQHFLAHLAYPIETVPGLQAGKLSTHLIPLVPRRAPVADLSISLGASLETLRKLILSPWTALSDALNKAAQAFENLRSTVGFLNRVDTGALLSRYRSSGSRPAPLRGCQHHQGHNARVLIWDEHGPPREVGITVCIEGAISAEGEWHPIHPDAEMPGALFGYPVQYAELDDLDWEIARAIRPAVDRDPVDDLFELDEPDPILDGHFYREGDFGDDRDLGIYDFILDPLLSPVRRKLLQEGLKQPFAGWFRVYVGLQVWIEGNGPRLYRNIEREMSARYSRSRGLAPGRWA